MKERIWQTVLGTLIAGLIIGLVAMHPINEARGPGIWLSASVGFSLGFLLYQASAGIGLAVCYWIGRGCWKVIRKVSG